jgi:hypothetical protein
MTGGAGGATSSDENSEYFACFVPGGSDRIQVFRLNPDTDTCVVIVLSLGVSSCQLEQAGQDWCVTSAAVYDDTAPCATQTLALADAMSTAIGGTYSVSGGAEYAVDLDLTVEFEEVTGLPASARVELSSCAADCSDNDCRQ